MQKALLGGGLLDMGVSDAHTKFASNGTYYLLKDTFSVDRAAGSINGTACDDGLGSRVVNDANNKLSIATDTLVIAAGTSSSWQQPALYLKPAQDAVIGRYIYYLWTATSNRMRVGVSLATNQDQAWSMYAAFGVINWRSGSPLAVGAFSLSTAYAIVIAIRDNGAFLMIKGGAFTEWRLLWAHTGSNPTPFLPHVSTFDSTGTVDDIIVPAKRWLPSPIVSDGYGSIFGVSDGLGHQEGLTSSYGSGGDGVSYSVVGAWDIDTGRAGATALSAGLALAMADANTPDILIRVDVTRSSGSAGLVLRYDADDYVYCVHDGTSIKLVKRVATVETTLINAPTTYVAGAKLVVRAVATKFRVYYNNLFIGSEQTINDASLQNEAGCGLYTTATDNFFDNFTAYAVGTGGEYAELDTI